MFIKKKVGKIILKEILDYHVREQKNMMLKIPDKYTLTAILLLIGATIFIAIALFTIRVNYPNDAFIICGMVLAMTGIFALTFSGGEPVNPRLLGLISAQNSISLCQIIHHLGMHGNAYFLPPSITGEANVMQFNPISTYNGRKGIEKGSFRQTGPAGLVIPPSCDLLIQDLRMRYPLVIPDNEEELTSLLRETIEDFFKFAHKISIRWDDSQITVTFHKYISYEGCKVIVQKSQRCCSISPCPACSLCGAIIAEGKDRVVRLDGCSLNSSSRGVSAVFSIMPLSESNP